MAHIWKICLYIVWTLSTAFGYVCDQNARECETTLIIENYFTMIHEELSSVFSANGKIYRYNVKNITSATPVPSDEVITADGWEKPRMVTVANRTLPAPDIIVYEGQTVIVHVINKMHSESVTIHWHGLHQRNTPYMDGVPFITQCPILPGQKFTYKFQAYPRGSFWYHSHSGSQRSSGLAGAFIVRKKEINPIEEHILQVMEWNHDSDAVKQNLLHEHNVIENRMWRSSSRSHDGMTFSRMVFHSVLINGKGRHYVDGESKDHNGAPLEVFHVRKGLKYRFRVLATGANFPFRISMDGHNLVVIESDGYPIQPMVVESFIINPGERFDFYLEAIRPIGNYWIRGKTLESNRHTIAEAILRYEGADEVEPNSKRAVCSEYVPCRVLNCPFSSFGFVKGIECIPFDQLKSSTDDDPAPPVIPGRFQEHFLNFGFFGKYPSVSGTEFEMPSVSALTQPREVNTLCEGRCPDRKTCRCTHSLQLQYGDTVQLVLSHLGMGSGWYHPIHMHGHSFHVVKMGYAAFDEEYGFLLNQNRDIDCSGGKNLDNDYSHCNNATWRDKTWLNGNIPGLELKNPPRKDTIIVPNGGYTVIRFKADNPGLWFMHCHIEIHSLQGMALVLNESFPFVPRAPKNFPECRNFDATGVYLH
ncbi:uncharacterized protein LOC134240755 [Saccostrea cucullata]|uniref:uncharacterized protein LOC134240755 n=1 Tax=Saccostrea cuccullata TaxID=36930 RepID=UPI002ED016FD